MGLVLDLESFDTKSGDDVEVPVASYEDGLLAGRAEAEAQFEQDQLRLNESMVQALTDSAFGYQEAQAHFLSGMKIYVDAVINGVLPAALAPALHAQLIATLSEGFEKDAKEQIKLHVSPDQFEPVTALVSQHGFVHVAVLKDDNLSNHAAFMGAKDRELSIDLDAALALIEQQSAVLFQPVEKVS